MFTSSIERRAIPQPIERRLGDQFETRGPQLLEQRAQRHRFAGGERLEIGERESRNRHAAGRGRHLATRSAAAAAVAGAPTIRTSPAAAGTVIGALGSAGTSATRTNVVRTPCVVRRTSSAGIPRAMMSWVSASVDSSASETDIQANSTVGARP